MKYCLFAVAMIFAMLFVSSTLFGFLYNVVQITNGGGDDTLIAVQSYYGTTFGAIGWIITSLALVLVDESDGLNPDDELDVAC